MHSAICWNCLFNDFSTSLVSGTGIFIVYSVSRVGENEKSKPQSAGNQRHKYSLVGTSETTRGTIYPISFCEWLAGLIDGDGCLLVSKQGYTSLEITIGLEDIYPLRYIQDKLGGSIKLRSGTKTYRYRLRNKEGMLKLISAINGHIRHSTRLTQLHRVCQVLNVPLINPQKPTVKSYWFAGFFDAVGTIGITMKNDLPQLSVRVTNKRLQDVEIYKTVFGGNIYYDSSKNGYYQWSIQNKKEVLNMLDYFNNVSFRYESEDVIKNLSLKIKKGETVALVGQSGSGKSTIANLISRFYDISDGEIKVDGKNIKEVNLKSLRKLIGLVTQDSILFNDSIKNNLLIGKENATDQEIIQALKIANAWEFVKELPETIESNIGDSGNKLSGGQKQRLSIARAVLKNPPIMILDEATSALDSESEHLVQIALDNVMKNKTSLVIAHRLSTIQKADNILVLDKGKIIESGKHKDLMDKGGTYTNLVRMQTI